MKTVSLPTGAKLVITPSPFADARALFQVALRELKGLKLDPKAEVDVNFFKDIFCAGFSSKEFESALQKCFERCTYNGLKITDETFEKVEAREDYFVVCLEVAKETLLPFTKSLSAQYAPILELLKTPQA